MNPKKCFIMSVMLSTCLIGLQTTLWGQELKDPNEEIKLLQEKVKQLEKVVESQRKIIEEQKNKLIYLRKLCSEAGIQVIPKDQRKATDGKYQQQDIRPTRPDIESIESPVIMKVGDGELRVRFQFTTLYIPASPRMEARLGYSSFFFVTYQEAGGTGYKKPTEGYFRVNGKAEKLTVRSSNEKVVSVRSYGDDYGLTMDAVGPGTANITVSLAGRSVNIPMKVVEIPIKGGGLSKDAHTKNEVIKILGLPDKREERFMSWPDSGEVDGIYYSTHSDVYGVSIEHWKYDKYPGLVISFQYEYVEEVRTVKKFETAD
jgi:hypothetical protein